MIDNKHAFQWESILEEFVKFLISKSAEDAKNWKLQTKVVSSKFILIYLWM